MQLQRRRRQLSYRLGYNLPMPEVLPFSDEPAFWQYMQHRRQLDCYRRLHRLSDPPERGCRQF